MNSRPLLPSIILSLFALTSADAATVQADLLCAAPDDAAVLDVSISPDCQHFGAVLKNAKGTQTLYLDGKEIATAEHFHGVAISPGGKHLAYALHDTAKKQWFVVRDGVPGRPYDSLEWRYPSWGEGRQKELVNLLFSPDGSHLAYLATLNGQEHLNLDEKECDLLGGTVCRNVEPIFFFSPDSKHFAYQLNLKTPGGGETCGILDGKKVLQWSKEPTYSADGAHCLYIGHKMIDNRTGKNVLVRDGVEGLPEDAGSLYISADLQHIGRRPRPNAAGQSAPIRITVDDQPWPPITAARDGILSLVDFVIAPHGAVAVLVKEEVRQADNSHIGYSVTYECTTAYLDGKPLPITATQLKNLALSPDGKHCAYVAALGNPWCVVADGTSFGHPSEVTPPTFTADSQHCIWAARAANGWTLYVDNDRQLDYPVFCTRTARALAEEPQLTTPGSFNGDFFRPTPGATPQPKPEWPLDLPQFLCNSDGTISYLGSKQGAIYRVTLKP